MTSDDYGKVGRDVGADEVEADGFIGGIRGSVDERGVARLEIYRPDRMNALDGAASARIIEVLADWADDPAVRVVILDGVGGSFSTGADVIDIASASQNLGGSLDAASARSVISNGSDLAGAVRAVPVPVIASIDGPAVGIGASLAIAADLLYATENSYVLLAFINIGLMPDGGASMSVASAVGRVRANAMTLLGDKLRAPEALAAGLLTGVVADRAALDAAVDKAAGKIASRSTAAMRLTKAALDAETMSGYEAAIERELSGQTELLQSDEFQAALAAFTGQR